MKEKVSEDKGFCLLRIKRVARIYGDFIFPKNIKFGIFAKNKSTFLAFYIDKSKLSVIKLDRLDSFIEAVVPKENTENVANDFSEIVPDIGGYITG